MVCNLKIPKQGIKMQITLCAVPWGVLSTVGVFSIVGDIMSTVEDILSTMGGVSVPWGIS